MAEKYRFKVLYNEQSLNKKEAGVGPFKKVLQGIVMLLSTRRSSKKFYSKDHLQAEALNSPPGKHRRSP